MTISCSAFRAISSRTRQREVSLTAVRADETDLLAQVQAVNRHAAGQMLWLTSQGFQVSGAQTGGIVTVYVPPTESSGHMAGAREFAAAQDRVQAPARRSMEGPNGTSFELNPFGALAEATEKR